MTAADWRHFGIHMRNGIAFAALILAVSFGVKLARAAGMVDDPDLAQRLTMVILGGYFIFTGNAMPKTLTPLSAMQCDGARAQAVHRFMGWTWVLTGLAFAAVWLVLPPDIAEPVSVALIVGGVLTVVAQILRVRRARHKEA
jgi:hypothetical protein